MEEKKLTTKEVISSEHKFTANPDGGSLKIKRIFRPAFMRWFSNIDEIEFRFERKGGNELEEEKIFLNGSVEANNYQMICISTNANTYICAIPIIKEEKSVTLLLRKNQICVQGFDRNKHPNFGWASIEFSVKETDDDNQSELCIHVRCINGKRISVSKSWQ